MTDEQKFFFDLRGWILLPSVLSDAEIETMKAECYAGARNGYEGALQDLLDHPAVAGILTEILSEEPFDLEECYGFRCENSFVSVRPPGWKPSAGGAMPHVVRPPQQANAMRYQAAGKKIFSGLTRVVWELEEVEAGMGGTSFLSGSHKAHFNYGGPNLWSPNIGGSPWEDGMRAAMEDYSCPAGSAVIFTESLAHASNDWTNPPQLPLRRLQLLQLPLGPVAQARSRPRCHHGDAAQAAHPLPGGLAVGGKHRILRGHPGALTPA